MCIDTVSLPDVSRYDDISIYCCISNTQPIVLWCFYSLQVDDCKNESLKNLIPINYGKFVWLWNFE